MDRVIEHAGCPAMQDVRKSRCLRPVDPAPRYIAAVFRPRQSDVGEPDILSQRFYSGTPFRLIVSDEADVQRRRILTPASW
jgi:hypothetical protein